jgi:hypothetical protein
VSALLDDCYVWLVNADCTTCNARIFLDGLNGANWNYESGVRIAPVHAHDTTRDDALVVFAEAFNQPPFTSRVIGQRIENQGPGTTPVTLSPGCGLGGTAGTNGGPFVVGNGSFEFTLSGAQPGALLFLSLGFGPTPAPCGTCTLTNPAAITFHQNFGGSAISPFPVPCNPAFISVALEFQWISFLTAANPCPAAAGLSASQRTQVTLGS